MAINITPLRDLIKKTIDYKVYNGNSNLTPIDADQGAVVITCTGSYPTSTPITARRLSNADGYIDHLDHLYYEFTYQIDIMKTVSPRPEAAPLVNFEKEAYTIINKIHREIPRLAKEYNLGLSRIRCRQFMDTINQKKPTHRLVGDFIIYSDSLVKTKEIQPAVECTKVEYKVLRGQTIVIN